MVYWSATNGGGGGGFVDAVIAVTPGETLNITVGEGGKIRSVARTFGGGGKGGQTSNSAINGGSGGGLSGIWRGTALTLGNQLVIAGGGGGSSPGAAGGNEAGGGGGGLTGLNDTFPGSSGRGGSPTAGGAAASTISDCSITQLAGSQFQGGDGAGHSGAAEGGGGGGGGWWGGGGGRCQVTGKVPPNGMGGGGSSYYAGTGVTSGQTYPGATASAASQGGAAARTGDPQYVSGVAVGGGNGNGGDGLVVIQYNPVVPVTDSGSGVAGTASTVIANVRSNDSVGGVAATSANSTITQSGSWPAGITLDTSTGAISITAAVAAGTYNVDYQLCNTGSPVKCATVTDIITVYSSQMTIAKAMTSNADEDGSGTINLNDTLTYTVTVTNTGTLVQQNVVVTDNKITPNSKTCATVAAGATCVLTGTYKVTQADVDAAKVSNTASAVSTAITTPITTTLDTTVVRVAKLTVTKTSSIPTGQSTQYAVPGIIVRYCITTQNTGTANATGVVMTDNLPAQVTYVSGSMFSGTSCASATTAEDDNNTGADESDPAGMSISGTTVSGSITSLAPGATVAFVFDTRIN